MRIFVPYAGRIDPRTLSCLSGLDYTAVECRGDEGYVDYLAQRWEEGAPFVNVEHDMVWHPGAIAELTLCPESWCSFGHAHTDDLARQGGAYLGLVRFSADFIARTRGIWAKPMFPQRSWRHCDGHINMAAKMAGRSGIKPHQHFPHVVNLGDPDLEGVSEVLAGSLR